MNRVREKFKLRNHIRGITTLTDIAEALNRGYEPTYVVREAYGEYQKFHLHEIIEMESTLENVVDFVNRNFTPDFREAYNLVASMSSSKDTETCGFWLNVYITADNIKIKKEEPISDFNDFSEQN